MAARTVMLRAILSILLNLLIFLVKKPFFYSCDSVCYSINYGELVNGVVDGSNILISESLWQFNLEKGIRPHLKVAVQLLLLLCGDVETCPGPDRRNIPELEELVKLRGFKSFHLNVRGLWGNLCHVTDILVNFRNIEIFCLSETHLTDEPEDIFKIEGYDFISKPRSSGKGGGVAAYISNRVNYLRRYDLESEEIECMWIEIKPKKSKSFLICVIYRSLMDRRTYM